jgi:hypothetical protein
MRKLATKLACATVCLLLLCAGNRSEAASLTDQEEALSNQQIAKVKELIHDAVQPSMDIINRKIDALVGVIEASHLSPGRSGQVQQIADYKPAKPEYNNNSGNEDEDNNNNDEHERKYEVKKYYYYIYIVATRVRIIVVGPTAVGRAAMTVIDHAAMTVIDHAAMAVIDHAAMAVIDRAVINPAITIADHVGMIPRTVSETKQTT